MAEGEVDKAISICKKGLAVYPHYEEAELILGEAYLTKGIWAEAKGILTRVLELDQQNLRALRGLLEIAQREEDVGRATQLAELILQIDPSNRKATSFLQEHERKQAPAEEGPLIEPPEATPLAPSEEEEKATVEAEEGPTIELPQVEESKEEITPKKGEAPSEAPPQPEFVEEAPPEVPQIEETKAEREEATLEEGEVPLETPSEEEVAEAKGGAEEQPTTEPSEAPFIEEPEEFPSMEGETGEPPPEMVAEEEKKIEEEPTPQPPEPPPIEEPIAGKEPLAETEEAKPEGEPAENPPPEITTPQEEREPHWEEKEPPPKKKEEGIPAKTGEELSALGLEEGIERLESEFAGIETPTLAEIYRKQGLWEKALEVYTRLLEKEPENEEYKAKIEEIKEEMDEGKDVG